MVFQHTAARRRLPKLQAARVSFILVSTHSRAEAAAGSGASIGAICVGFQHTAARRRLHIGVGKRIAESVSTHSRAEAAACCARRACSRCIRFNTQPRGGGCWDKLTQPSPRRCFNTQPRGGGCTDIFYLQGKDGVSTHSRAEAAAHFL